MYSTYIGLHVELLYREPYSELPMNLQVDGSGFRL